MNFEWDKKKFVINQFLNSSELQQKLIIEQHENLQNQESLLRTQAELERSLQSEGTLKENESLNFELKAHYSELEKSFQNSRSNFFFLDKFLLQFFFERN